MNWDFGPLRSVIATPVFHRWHRSREPEAWDKNFAGLLPIWDILFGTSNVPKDRWSENFGINEPMLGGVLVHVREGARDAAFGVLARGLPEAGVQRRAASVEAFPVVRAGEKFDAIHGLWPGRL